MTHDRNGAQVLRYLDDHRLEHTPDHYEFAHRFLFGHDPTFKRRVDDITNGGIRIAPGQIRQLAPPIGTVASAEIAPRLDGLTLRVLDIAGDAASATGKLNRDLVTAMTAMLSPDGADLRSIVGEMIERTAKAEASLGEATRQAKSLHDELDALRDIALQDSLTGLLSRQSMEERVAAASVRKEGCSVAFVDLDRFVSINGNYGHAVGDRVLKAVADTLRECCSPHAIARWRGDKFVVLFEAMGTADAGSCIEKAREALSMRQLKLRENDKPLGTISFSAGVVSSRSRTAAAIIEAAERLTRDAKQRGRDTVVMENALVGV